MEANSVAKPDFRVRPSSGQAAPRVVIVEGDPEVCDSLKFSLEAEGFAVRVYGSGAELLRSSDIPVCDCLVIDQRTPDMTGMELIASLRGRNVLVPAILTIGNPSAALAGRAALAGVAVVEKPLLGNTLAKQIRVACRY